MSVAFSSDDHSLLERKVLPISRVDCTLTFPDEDIERCAQWILSNNFEKIALQFPDSALKDACSIALKLEETTKKKIFILGDTSYGSCCVDTLAAERVCADALVHWGPSCLSPTTNSIPILYIFGKAPLEEEDFVKTFCDTFVDREAQVVLLYDVLYFYAIKSLTCLLKEYRNLIISTLEIPNVPSESQNPTNKNVTLIKKCHREILMPSDHELQEYSMFYIGSESASLLNLTLVLNQCGFYSYNPCTKIVRTETSDNSRFLKRRSYYIEKAKAANIIGILVGTLGVSNYLEIIKYLRTLIQEAGKKHYTIAVGKPNVAKLANFPDIDVFVHVACSECVLMESRELFRPVITTYELEVALNGARQWTGDFVTDFRELLPGGACHVPPAPPKETGVSLVGRSSCLSMAQEQELLAPGTLAAKGSLTVSSVHAQASGELLSQRSWQGLEQHLGETPVPSIEQGRKGIACQYEDESPQT